LRRVENVVRQGGKFEFNASWGANANAEVALSLVVLTHLIFFSKCVLDLWTWSISEEKRPCFNLLY